MHGIFGYNKLLTRETNNAIHASSYPLILQATGASEEYLQKEGAVYIPLFLSKHPLGGFSGDYLPDKEFTTLVSHRFPYFLNLDPLIKKYGGPQLFWKQDYHLTPDGYLFIATRIASHVEEIAKASRFIDRCN